MDKKLVAIFKSQGKFTNHEVENTFSRFIYPIMVFPILYIEDVPCEKISISNVQAILITSTNSLYYLSKLYKERNIKVFTVGSSSYKLAKKLGFKNVIDCAGDSVKMLNVVIEKTTKKSGSLLYLGAKEVSVDLTGVLENLGYNIKRYVVYKSREVKVPNKNFFNLIKLKKISWIVLLSRKGAANFSKLFLNKFSINYFKYIKFACLSENVSNALSNKIKLKYYPDIPSLENLKSTILQNE